MTFASPAWLLLLLLGGVIAFLHSRPRRNIEVGSLFLWRQLKLSVPPKASRRLPVPNLLLVLQLVALLAITLALARPTPSGGEPPPDHWIVLLDASASMEATVDGVSAFDEAQVYLSARLENQQPLPSRVTVVRVASSPVVEVARLQRPESVIEAANGMWEAHTGADWTRVPAVVRGLMLAGERTRMTVLTDAPGSAAARSVEDAVTGMVASVADSGDQAEATERAAIDFEVISFGESATNLSLTAAEPTLLDPVSGLWRIAGEFRRHDALASDEEAPVTVRILFEPDAGRAAARPGAALPDQVESGTGLLEWTSLDVPFGPAGVGRFDQTISLPGPGLLEIRLPEDPLATDNSLRFVLRDAPRSARVLYVGPGDPDLDLALRVIPGVSITRSRTLQGSPEDYDLVVLDGVSEVGPTGTNTVWLGASPDGLELGALADPTPSGWMENHPLSRSVDWGSLGISTALDLELLPGAVAVVEAPGGHPLAQARTTTAGREVVLAFRIQDTDWPDQLGFPAFITNLLLLAVPDLGLAVEPPCLAGTTCPIGPRQLSANSRLLSPVGSEVSLPALPVRSGSSVGDRTPSATEDPLAVARAIAADMASTFRPERSGVYRLVSDGDDHAVAVNAVVPEEADLTAANQASAGAVDPDLRVASDWPPAHRWLLVLALLALAAEGWIAGRRGERFFRFQGLRGGNPLAPRHRAVLALRLVALAFLVLAVLDPRTPVPTRESSAVLVVDEAAATSPEARERADSFVQDAAASAGRNRRLGVVRVGAVGQVAADLGSAPTERQPRLVDPPAADLEASLRLAAALLPPETSGRITVVVDGVETRGSVATVLPELLARRIPVDVILPPETATQDVALEELSLPAVLRPNERAQLRTVIRAAEATRGSLRLLREGEVQEERPIELQRGRNRIDLEIWEEEVGDFLYEAEVVLTGGDDMSPRNDRNGILVEVREPARVAIVTPQPAWGRSFANALAVQGLAAEVLPPNLTPTSAPGGEPPLSGFDAVALMNVPAAELPDQRASELEAWIREAGGGLILIGGENTFGPGGYFDSPLEAVSPLSAKIPQELPNLAIVFVLDRSGSMGEGVGGQGSRLDIAKVATLEAIDLLHPETEVGVIAFDLQAYSVVPLQPAGNREQIREQIERLETGGGTWIYPGLALAFVELSKVDPEFRRHVVLMSDGRSQFFNHQALMSLISDEGITVSTAAIGAQADVQLMEELARRGRGAAHATVDFSELPSILTGEATRFSSSALREVSVRLTPVGDAADGGGPFGGGPPDLGGFVRTTAKPGAQVHIEAGEDTPLLASWRYGLGRVVAFASHGAGAWTAEWMESPEYSPWWAQTVRWAAASARLGLNVRVGRDRDYGRIVAEVAGVGTRGEGEPALQAVVRGPDGTTRRDLRWVKRSPGVFETDFMLDLPGSYGITVEPTDPDAADLEPVEKQFYVGSTGREAATEPNRDLLVTLASVTGGRVLTNGESVFSSNTAVRWPGRSVWVAWALLALGVFLFELLGRYTGLLRRLVTA